MIIEWRCVCRNTIAPAVFKSASNSQRDSDSGLVRWCFYRHIVRVILLSSCELDRYINVTSSWCQLVSWTVTSPCYHHLVSWKVNRQAIIMLSSSCYHHLVTKVYPSQTKILEGVTKDEMRIFEALFKGGSTQFGPRTIEKCFENPHFIFCYSFQNLRLGSIKFTVRMHTFIL